jgi:replicative DNA helicase
MLIEERESIVAYSKEVEATVLAGMLCNKDSFSMAMESLKEEDFFDSTNRKLFRIIIDTYEQNGSVDTPLFIAYVNDKKISNEEYKYILDIQGDHSFYSNITAYCEVLRQYTIKRNTISLLKQGIRDLNDGIEPSKGLERIIETAKTIKESKPHADSLFRHLLEPISEQSIFEEMRNVSPGARVGIKLGEIDLKLPGGALTIVAAPTGHGKTLLLINFILNYLELYPDKKAYFFTYEESRGAIISIFINTYINEEISKNNRESIKSYFIDGSPSYVSKDKQGLFLNKKDEFFKKFMTPGRLNILYSDYCAEELAQATNFLKDNSSVGLIAVDYMQLLNSMDKKVTQRQEELKRICLMLKDCAVNTGLPIVLAAQFNRQVINEATISPVQIGEAGDIERVANMILGLWNRNYNEVTEDSSKGKNGRKIPKESTIYLEMLKSREYGIGHSGVFNLNGNTGKLTGSQSSLLNEKKGNTNDRNAIPNDYSAMLL